MKNIFVIIICILVCFGCKTTPSKMKEESTAGGPVKVELKKNKGQFQLYVNKEPFYIKGAGLEFGNISSVAKHHGNSFRTWRTNNGQRSAKEVLDEAYENGLLVTMGIEVARERHGFDYNNEVAVKEQKERIKQEVLELKDHPALFIWAIGNELNLRANNPKVWDAVNDISKMIHEIDPNHLTTTALAGISQQDVDYIEERCSDIDVLSVQLYGKIEELPQMIQAYGFKGPYIVSEWGATGHWEVPKTSWGSPIEENSTIKATDYLKRYTEVIAADSAQCIGSYVFLWGQKQERTPTWYGMFLEDGTETESVDAMHYAWNGVWPENRTPQVKSFTINDQTAYDNVQLNLNQESLAIFKSTDLENDTLKYLWEILPESIDLQDGGDVERRPKAYEIKIISTYKGELKFKAPGEKGNYRLFGYVTDGFNHSATANIPFKVI